MWFLRFFGVELGLVLMLVGALFGSLVDVLDGAADFSGEGGELGVFGVFGAEVLGRGEELDVAVDGGAFEDVGESELEEVEGLEQEIVGGG